MVDGPTTGKEKTQIPMQRTTILEAFQNKVGKENSLYGADLEIEDQTAIEKTVELAKDASKIILCLGEKITQKRQEISVIYTLVHRK
jgi:beta-glucosidase